jgi:hypothetical protein
MIIRMLHLGSKSLKTMLCDMTQFHTQIVKLLFGQSHDSSADEQRLSSAFVEHGYYAPAQTTRVNT